jgi:hypothetical protein
MSWIHNVFHMSPFELHKDSDREQPGNIPMLHVEGNDKYEVDKILDSKRICSKIVHLVN